MLHGTSSCCARYQPFALGIQTRFRWRHKETDRWRRLMDATCFAVDWLGQTRGGSIAASSGNWTHIVTCAHVICPWDYPNYYPPTGVTRFVSHLTLADTMTQVRVPTMQGHAMYRHFTSNHHVFVHSNPRLDLCVVHPEIDLRRSGEVHMLWLQNEGYALRPRLELTARVSVGDRVWVYGMRAHESLFDDEDDGGRAVDPRMIPTGIAGVVRAVSREHFFVDTTVIEGEERGTVHMGMCGSVVMRHGRCVGMVTATVHPRSSCAALAGTAMCTHVRDVFEFLLEVEKQMKTPLPQKASTVFQERRRSERAAAAAAATRECGDGSNSDNYSDRNVVDDDLDSVSVVAGQRDWGLHTTRLARHVRVPSSLWHMEERWMREEGSIDSSVYGPNGALNQETQENVLGLDMNSSTRYGERPRGVPSSTQDEYGNEHNGMSAGTRPDKSPTGVYTRTSTAGSRNSSAVDDVSASASEMVRASAAMVDHDDTLREFGVGVDDVLDDAHRASLRGMRDALAQLRRERGGAGKDGDKSSSSSSSGTTTTRTTTTATAAAAASDTTWPPPHESVIARKKRERREQEAEHQRRLRERHGEHGEAGDVRAAEMMDEWLSR